MPHTESDWLSIDQVLAMLPSTITRAALAQLRYEGKGPAFYKPTPRTVLYKRSEINAWIEQTRQTTTAAVQR